jgi:hypothetical protein
MPNGRDSLPGNKKEEQDTLTKAVFLAPLFSLALRLLELLLRVLRVIN